MKDFCLNTDAVFLSGDLENVLQQIDMLLDTRPGEVLGENTGSDLQRFLWDMKASASTITDYVLSTIMEQVNLLGYSVDVDTKLLQGEQNDIIIISIQLSRDGTTHEKTYKIG